MRKRPVPMASRGLILTLKGFILAICGPIHLLILFAVGCVENVENLEQMSLEHK